jgi:quercetin 2,3-dioxygenase
MRIHVSLRLACSKFPLFSAATEDECVSAAQLGLFVPTLRRTSGLVVGDDRPSRRTEMLFKGTRTAFVRDMGGFVVHLNMPGLLDPKSRDHGRGPLALVVESILAPGRVIAMHEHCNDEIISWVPEGVMRHDDRAEGKLVIDRDHLTVMNAGRSFWHSEQTLPSDPPLRMLQILIRPRAVGLQPRIQYGPIPARATNRWRHLVGAEDGDAPFHVRNAVDFFDIRLQTGTSEAFPARDGSDLYFYVFAGSISAGGETFAEGEQGLMTDSGTLSFNANSATIMVAFLIDRAAAVTRQGTVGDHRKLPAVWILRVVQRWKQLTHRFR